MSSRSSDLLNDAGEARHALRHADGELVLGRSLDLLGDARCATPVRHAEKKLVSKILGEKKAPIPFPVSGPLGYFFKTYRTCRSFLSAV